MAKSEDIDLVRKRLWSCHMRVKSVMAGGYHLLVNGSIRVKVIRKGTPLGARGETGEFDVLAVVEHPMVGSPVIGYRAYGFSGPGGWETSPTAVFSKAIKIKHGKE